jgi:hypothetical protein
MIWLKKKIAIFKIFLIQHNLLSLPTPEESAMKCVKNMTKIVTEHFSASIKKKNEHIKPANHGDR